AVTDFIEGVRTGFQTVADFLTNLFNAVQVFITVPPAIEKAANAVVNAGKLLGEAIADIPVVIKNALLEAIANLENAVDELYNALLNKIRERLPDVDLSFEELY